MKLKDLTENQVVQTTNENDKQFRELLHKEGFKWNDGMTYVECSMFGEYATTCYNVKKGVFCSKDHYEKEEKEILQASDFLTPKIKKSELLEKITGVNESVEAIKNMLLRKGVLTEQDFISYIVEKHDIKEATISDCKPAEQPQFEVGKVYKSKMAMFFCTRINDDELYGYGFDFFGNWNEENYVPFRGNFTEATPKEWFERMEQEAKRRGFNEGVRFNSPNATHDFSFNQKIIKENFKWYAGSRSLGCSTDKNPSSGNVMQDGKWAEIIEEPKRMTVKERDELEKPFNPDEYQSGTLGAFWDGDWDEALNDYNIHVGYLEYKKDSMYKSTLHFDIWQNFKPLNFD